MAATDCLREALDGVNKYGLAASPMFRGRQEDSSMTKGRLIDHFPEAPLYTRACANGFGTIFTAVYRPASGKATFIGPGKRVEQSLQSFRTGQHRQLFGADTDAAVAGPVH